MGREPDEHSWETRVTDYLTTRLSKLGVAHHRDPFEPGRDNLVAWLPGPPDGDVVIWEAHQDTVPVEGMTIPPFEPQERDGRLYGRGACDVKGGMAAMLAAFERLAQKGSDLPMTLVAAFSVNEEAGGGS